MIKDILVDQRGYGMAELLLVTCLVVSICGVVVSIILPKIGGLHDNAKSSIESIGGSGI